MNITGLIYSTTKLSNLIIGLLFAIEYRHLNCYSSKKTGENMQPHKIIFLIFSSILPILFTNCSPSQNVILNLKPQTENSEWYKGKEIAHS